MNNEPLVIDWQITNHCNRTCGFCYGPKVDENSLSFQDCLKFIDLISNLGFKIIGITGGEPLTHRRIDDILKYIKGKGLLIGLNTNCDLYNNHRDVIIETVDALEIPIESGTQCKHDNLRGKGNYVKVMEALRDSYYSSSRLIYRIGSVLMEDTCVNDLMDIETILSEYKDRIAYWKIYEYIAYSNKEMNTLQVSSNRFSVISKQAKSLGLGNLIGSSKIIFDSKEMRNRSYFLVRPNGTAFVPLIEEDQSLELELGNFINEGEEIISRWRNIVKMENYTNCIRCIFRSDTWISCLLRESNS